MSEIKVWKRISVSWARDRNGVRQSIWRRLICLVPWPSVGEKSLGKINFGWLSWASFHQHISLSKSSSTKEILPEQVQFYLHTGHWPNIHYHPSIFIAPPRISVLGNSDKWIIFLGGQCDLNKDRSIIEEFCKHCMPVPWRMRNNGDEWRNGWETRQS